MLKKLFAAIFLFTISIAASSQTTQQYKEYLSGFLMTSVTGNLSPKWMTYLELQTRSFDKFSKPDYYEIKGGVGYNINPKNQPFIGLGRYVNYTDGSMSQAEFRIWLQYMLVTNIGKLRIENRFRAEQRYFHNPLTGANTNGQRYRYRANAILPLNNDKLLPKTFFLNGFEEVFVGPHDPFFKRNRIFGGAGYQFTKSVNAATGYMWQRELSTAGNKSLHFAYLAVNFILNRKDFQKDHTISVPVAD